MNDISFDGLSSSKFEEFCFDLLHASGFVNLDWRKGTGLGTSPADKGRDIVTIRAPSRTEVGISRGGSSTANTSRRVCRRRSFRTCLRGQTPTGLMLLCLQSRIFSATLQRSTWRPTGRTTTRRLRFGIG